MRARDCSLRAGERPVSPTVSEMRLAEVDVAFGSQIARAAAGEEFASDFLWAGGGGDNRKRPVVEIFREAAAEVGREAFAGSRPVELGVEVTCLHGNAGIGAPSALRHGEHPRQPDADRRRLGPGAGARRGRFPGPCRLGGAPKAIAELSGRSQRQLVKEAIVSGIRDWLSTIRAAPPRRPPPCPGALARPGFPVYLPARNRRPSGRALTGTG